MIEVLIGIISGVISGLGAGGGTILILILTAFMGYEQHISQSANLIFFVPTALASIIINTKQKLIKYKLAIPITIVGIIGAIIGANISVHLDVKILKKKFAIFLFLIAIREIISIYNMYIKDKKTHNNGNK